MEDSYLKKLLLYGVPILITVMAIFLQSHQEQSLVDLLKLDEAEEIYVVWNEEEKYPPVTLNKEDIAELILFFNPYKITSVA